MKSIDTLVQDIYEVVEGNGGWDETVNKYFLDSLGVTMLSRLSAPDEHKSRLRLSNVGKPCKRQLYYSINEPDQRETLTTNTRIKFLYGDILEELLLALAIAAGHRVEGLQSELKVYGITGHRDAVIDGVTIDVKSASPFSFKKFKDGGLREDDPFGYISQLSSYVLAGQGDTEVQSDPTVGAFLVIDKVNGHIHLDKYDFTEELKTKEQEMVEVKGIIDADTPPEKPESYQPVPQSKTSPNTKLPTVCSYCSYKRNCWESLRTFLYSSGPLHLVDVVNEPKVFEIKYDS